MARSELSLRIDALRDALEEPGLSEASAQYLRGQIRMARDILDPSFIEAIEDQSRTFHDED